MARTIWSTRFIEIGPGEPNPFIEVNVPDGFVWDVRDVNALWIADTPDLLAHEVHVTAHNSVLWIAGRMLWRVTYRWEGRQILGPGERLRADFGLGNDFHVKISGYQLEL